MTTHSIHDVRNLIKNLQCNISQSVGQGITVQRALKELEGSIIGLHRDVDAIQSALEKLFQKFA